MARGTLRHTHLACTLWVVILLSGNLRSLPIQSRQTTENYSTKEVNAGQSINSKMNDANVLFRVMYSDAFHSN